jgi:hypothetical protein
MARELRRFRWETRLYFGFILGSLIIAGWIE